MCHMSEAMVLALVALNLDWLNIFHADWSLQSALVHNHYCLLGVYRRLLSWIHAHAWLHHWLLSWLHRLHAELHRLVSGLHRLVSGLHWLLVSWLHLWLHNGLHLRVLPCLDWIFLG